MWSLCKKQNALPFVALGGRDRPLGFFRQRVKRRLIVLDGPVGVFGVMDGFTEPQRLGRLRERKPTVPRGSTISPRLCRRRRVPRGMC